MLNYDLILSRDSYLLAVELRLFWFVAAVYGLAMLLYVFHMVTRASVFGRAAQATLVGAVIAHVGLIALRAFETGRLPFLTLYESLSLFSLTAAAAYLMASRRWENIHFPGLFVTALSLGASLYALYALSPAVEPLAPELKSTLFYGHAVLSFLSYAVFGVSAAVEASYLIMNPFLKRGGASGYGLTPENLRVFHSSAFRLVLLAYPLLTAAIFSGALWSNNAWGRYWSWTPKETWSLLAWTVFTLYLHSKTVPALRDIPASVFNILAFLSVIMTVVGANWLASLLGIPGLSL